MENNKHLESEIKGFWGDIKATEEQLSYERQNYAKTLKNGLGEDIINHLNNPPKMGWWQRLKFRIRYWWYKRKSRD